MAILSKKFNTETSAETVKSKAAVTLVASDIIVQPRLSEKAVNLDKLNKFVFTVKKNANKIEIRKALERFYGITIAQVNVINVKGKNRNYGKTSGKTSDFKKAIVTLTKDSKKPEILQAK